ncbi:septum formation family protein [Parafrankia sp. FMc2]|uniref:septum formation family protein n=1 Tax=Parafrankia sp. FMc2 TaxID=3233196 RepID=UPI0034D43B92
MPGISNRGGRWRTGWRDHAVTIAINVVLLGAVIWGLVALHSDDSAARDPAGGNAAAGGDTVTPSPTTSTDPSVELLNVDLLTGHCYSWDQDKTMSDVDDVPCAGPHLFEAAGRASLFADHPISDLYPTPDQWGEIIHRSCPDIIRAYLGYPLDPYGRFAAGGIHPEELGWDRGERLMTCGIVSSDSVGDARVFRLFEGGARGAGQARIDDQARVDEQIGFAGDAGTPALVTGLTAAPAG